MISKLNILIAGRTTLISTCLRFGSSNSIPPRVSSLFEGLVTNKRADLARSITLIETTNQQKKREAQLLLNLVLGNLKTKRQDNSKHSLRIGYWTYPLIQIIKYLLNASNLGFTGPPGAGKSSLIETFGKYMTNTLGLKVAVLTIDPSSSTTGGSTNTFFLKKSNQMGCFLYFICLLKARS